MLHRATSIFAFLVLLLVPLAAFAHRLELEAGEKECFFETLDTQDKMTVTYEVGGGGHLDVDFYVMDPNGNVINKQDRKPQGSFSIQVDRPGRFTYCFSNEFSSMSSKTLSFNVHGQLFMGDEEQIAPVEQEIRDLSAGLQLVKDEQAYLVVRERVHRDSTPLPPSAAVEAAKKGKTMLTCLKLANQQIPVSSTGLSPKSVSSLLFVLGMYTISRAGLK
ncbi:hypothetical protein L202_03809 [Cryptococcus amylolentus CBS 6039]|uniref:GOLD domain-containing protein n=1 Tax=Cryptococcus amylolentus CBS 6039 TaxID=1295533 RepID=A0A1E3HWE4_9TREE|nr:hypothetical protein L202_03809 [Cryptococcus amylolentus CBS 6039]ODN79921.1 hypothetical protein L202_03809 [Cryptococcus amylolentus CBS 6039]